MNSAELKNELHKEVTEEIKGCCHYLDMAEVAEELGENALALGLFLMAKDELSHAKFAEEHIDLLTPEQREMHAKAKMRLEHFANK